LPNTHTAVRTESTAAHIARLPAAIRYAFSTFLGIPTAVVAGFFVLAVGTYFIDHGEVSGL
jgi:hypothetical protein